LTDKTGTKGGLGRVMGGDCGLKAAKGHAHMKKKRPRSQPRAGYAQNEKKTKAQRGGGCGPFFKG
jgi:hypothetical protein